MSASPTSDGGGERVRSVVLTRFGGTDGFAARETTAREPGPGEVRVLVRAIGFNPVDVKARQGALCGTPPLVLGRDLSGVVEAVGPGVTTLRPGDEVYARGNEAYVEAVTLPAALVALKPRTLGFAQAAALPVAGLTAYQAVMVKARVQPGDAVLVAGASGGVGSVAVQLLRHLGASPVLVTAGSERSARYLVDTLGVAPEHVIFHRGRSVEELAAEVAGLAGGQPLKATFDFAGGEMKRLCFLAVGVDGHVVSIVEEPADFDLNLWDEDRSPLVVRSASFHFVQLAARLTHAPESTWPVYARQLDALARLIDAGHVSPVAVEDVGPFSVDAVREAHRRLEAGGVQGKLVASVASDAP